MKNYKLLLKSFNMEPDKYLQHIKNSWDFYASIKNPKFIVAPMVDQSELAFRMLTRRYKADLCYTPMLHSKIMVSDKSYKKNNFDPHKDDRPLIVQFCGNDPKTILEAAKMVENECDGVDINLGCPQGIARRGHYGSFLLENPDLICEMVKNLHDNLSVPVTCKIRILQNENDTIELCKKIENAGCYLLTVHGRTKEQNKDIVGECDWDIIKKIKQIIKIPVFANGGIYNYSDVIKCLDYTKVDGVMSAEAILENPSLFVEKIFDLDDIAIEYLELCKIYNTENKYIKPHLFKILYTGLQNNIDQREKLAKANKFNEFVEVALEIKKRREGIPLEEKFGWYKRHWQRIDKLKKENTDKLEEKKEMKECNINSDVHKKFKIDNENSFVNLVHKDN